MKNVFSIFKSDIKSLCKRFFALVVAIGIVFIPALYSGFNLYANWDPYANTGNIPIAVYSCDDGYVTDDGVYENKGNDVVEELLENDSVNFIKVNNKESAIAGVEAGDYYAALVILPTFSKKMYELDTAISESGEGTIDFYENTKKNAIAAKICESVAGTIETSIKETYLSVVFEMAFDAANDAAEELKNGDSVEKITGDLEKVSQNLLAYNGVLSKVLENDQLLEELLISAETDLGTTKKLSEKSTSDISSTSKAVNNSREDLKIIDKEITSTLSEIEDGFDRLSKLCLDIGKVGQEFAEENTANVALAVATTENIKAKIEYIQILLPYNPYEKELDTIYEVVNSLNNNLKVIQSQLESISTKNYGENVSDIADSCSNIANISKHLVSGTLIPETDRLLKNFNNSLDLLVPIVNALGIALDDSNLLLEETHNAKDSMRAAILDTQSLINSGADALKNLAKDIREGRAQELIDDLIRILEEDPEEYGAFLASPVKVNTTDVYKMDTYGSAMVPFYSTLALWVGGVMLVTIFKVEPDITHLENVKNREMYFGKLLLFWLLGQIQTLIIVASDLFLLNAPCQHPGMFWLACACTSLVFVTFIFSLTLSFGDLGKGIVVVIMVLQIAGSSGSYPIELLPDIFGNMYLFFPFPYAINAMREALCGMYGSDLYIYLTKLSVFAVIGMFIGLIIRRPFIEIKHFMEEELEKTGLL